MKERNSQCPFIARKISKGESFCKRGLVVFTRFPWERVRKIELDGLALDGYCHEMKIAFEFQGKQRFGRVGFLQPDEANFERRKYRDEKNLRACKAHGVA